MARPTLGTHPKFFRLASLVGGRGVARGALELIWDAAYASGDPVIGDSVSVEAVADWRGKPGELTSALVSSGFLDVVQADANGGHLHTFAVHDLEDHAPDYVLKRWEREAKRKAAGDTLRTVRQRAAAASWDASVRRLPASVPPPAPARSESLSSPPLLLEASDPDPETRAIHGAGGTGVVVGIVPRGRMAHLGAATVAFLDCFNAYPNGNAKQAAAQAWQDVAATFEGGEQALRDAIMARFTGGMLKHPPWDEPRFCVNFEKFLRERRWEDPGLKPTTRAGPKKATIDPFAKIERRTGGTKP